MDIVSLDGAKNRLQEYCQQRYLPLPVYQTLEKAGPDHSPLFQVEVIVNGMSFIGDWASKKREAEKLAAMEAFIGINKPPSPPEIITNFDKKGPSDWLEKLHLVTEEQQIESMECD